MTKFEKGAILVLYGKTFFTGIWVNLVQMARRKNGNGAHEGNAFLE